MKTLRYVLTGTDAATAKILATVQAKFFDSNDSFGRMEFYITAVMCADGCAAWEVKRDKIVKIVNATYDDYLKDDTVPGKRRINSAFRKLVRAGFFYSKIGYEGPQGDKHRVRYYALNQDRYRT